MPYQLRNRTRVEKTESASSSAASSATLEHNEDGATPLSRGSGTNRLKRGLSGSTKEGADQLNVISDKGLPPQKRKKRRCTEYTDMVNDKTLRTSLVKSLDMLYQGLQNSQRTTEAILGRIETQHRTLIFELLIKGELETLPVAQTRRLFEQGFWDIEKQVRMLVSDLVGDMWAQQRRVIGLKRGIIQYYGAVKAR